METSPGARLALLLLGGFESMTSRVIAELDAEGHPGVTATHEFALRAIDRGAGDAAALARSLGVSRQAAAKTIEALERMGYLRRVADDTDARRKKLVVTSRGYEMSTIGASAFDALRAQWQEVVGEERVRLVEAALLELVGGEPSDPGSWPPS